MQNPLESYRHTQRELRRHFEAFTRANCPTCPTPCCRRPARILPTDILLAEATGWRAQLPAAASAPGDHRCTDACSAVRSSPLPDLPGAARRAEEPPIPPADMVAETAGRMAKALGGPPETSDTETESLPCEYLGEHGCTFPSDLRPFGCTTYICRYMHERMDRQTLSRIKRLTRELEAKHTILLRTVRNVRWEV
jgi:hypothetical protein